MFIKRAITAAVAISFSFSASALTMQEMFDSINASGNVSSPGVFQGQTMNLYTGGSMFMRMPQRSYNLATATPPAWGAGCGGIDLFAGGFSFINKEQFISMLRNIGSNSLGYAFKLALQNLCPTCDNVMEALKSTANAINGNNINSCQAAEGLVNASVPDTWKKSKASLAQTFGAASNRYSDAFEAWSKVTGDSAEANASLTQATSANPALKEKLASGNITWKALKRIPDLDDSTRMMFMSMIGAYIYDSATEQVRSLPDTNITVEALLGNSASGTVDVTVYVCDTTGDDGCMNPTPSSQSLKSLTSMVRERMQTITDGILNRERPADIASVISFVNQTSLPVYKLLSVSTSMRQTGFSDQIIARYQELIAAEYAAAYIGRAMRDIKAGFSLLQSQGGPASAQATDQLTARAHALQSQLQASLSGVYGKAASMTSIAQEIMQMERALNSSLPTALQNSVAWQRGL